LVWNTDVGCKMVISRWIFVCKFKTKQSRIEV
jgi:hypothetical protein